MASLDSCKSDRYWAYRKLLNYWDKSFEPKVKEVWEKFMSPCAPGLSPQYKLPTDTCMDEFLKSADFCQSAKPEIMIPKIVEPQPPSEPEYLEKMQVSNPALKKLMDEFDLEQDLEELPF